MREVRKVKGGWENDMETSTELTNSDCGSDTPPASRNKLIEGSALVLMLVSGYDLIRVTL
jgi:hypothetical protein